jgi:isopenicillin N synthase-like dioxygenase
MEALAKELFGEDAEVYFSNDTWHIDTGVGEFFDPEQHKGRAAYEYYNSWDSGENALERWARKNGHGSESMAELFDSYDAHQEEIARQTVADVRRWIEQDIPFDWEGGPEWRDEVLKYAEEHGL